MIDMTIAGTCISAQCARSTGSATLLSDHKCFSGGRNLTYSHDHQETCTEPAEIYHSIASIFHEVIGVGTSCTHPVRYRCKNVCCNNEESEEVVEEGG